ncbi:DUF3631 domain-containing protein [Kineococcus sp. SYSU DK002]|uniref:DUF3631 domain-containing protein n=1 Tax=Kineococcus sp. SYSU DK002 TaxID=3383123 RepID=UPI003D7CF967
MNRNAVADVTVKSESAGAQLLNDVDTFLRRFVAYPSDHARRAHVLWVAHAHLMGAWESTPRIGFLSKEPGSGKTRALEVTELLVPRPIHAVNATPAALFRKVSDKEGAPTILYDEIDTVFGPKAKDNEEIRGMLNAGHRQGATSLRCVVKGKSVEVEEMPAYCAVALSGLGDLPDTIMTRSVVVRMRRRSPDERVEPFRYRVHAPEGHHLRDRLTDWARAVEPQVTDAWPEMPEGIQDRAADVWEPLLAVADAAGGHWPVDARVAATTMHGEMGERAQTIGITLLIDIKAIFDRLGEQSIFSDVLLDELHHIELSGWDDFFGKPLDFRTLSKHLKGYGVSPTAIRKGEDVRRGYKREALVDAWSRYLPASSDKSATSATPLQAPPPAPVPTPPTLAFDEHDQWKPTPGVWADGTPIPEEPLEYEEWGAA